LNRVRLACAIAAFASAACSSQPGIAGPPGPPGVPCSGCVDAASVAPAAIQDAHVAASGITTRTKLPATLAYEDEPNVFTQPQTMQELRVGGSVSVGSTDAPAAALDVRGEVFTEGLYQVGTAAPVPYRVTTRRYVVEAGPSVVGQVVPLDLAIMQALCQDIDGCRVTIQMVNFEPTGNTASRTAQLFLSQTTNAWRLDNDVLGVDGDGTTSEWVAWDCIFTDAENRTNSANGRADTAKGFGFLNAAGGTYNDTTTICRISFQD
jgi:hypothetical protein